VTSSTDTSTHYLILGIRPDAGSDDVRAAYRDKMRLWHPDLLPGADEEVRQTATQMTARINEAYETLTDPKRRAAYDARRADISHPAGRQSTSAPRRRQPTRRQPSRPMVTVSLGGIVAPLLGMTWASGLLPAPPPLHPPLIAALCAAVMAATIWLLASSRLLRRRDRLSRIGVVWTHLMRWSGWVVIGCSAVFLGIPVIALTLMAVFAAPFFGLVLIALITGRSDPER
jgi:DnaJ-domain-containing protein 1